MFNVWFWLLVLPLCLIVLCDVYEKVNIVRKYQLDNWVWVVMILVGFIPLLSYVSSVLWIFTLRDRVDECSNVLKPTKLNKFLFNSYFEE